MQRIQRTNRFLKEGYVQTLVGCVIALFFTLVVIVSLITLLSVSFTSSLVIGLLIFGLCVLGVTYKPVSEGLDFQVPYCYLAAKFKGQKIVDCFLQTAEFNFLPDKGESIKLFDLREQWQSMTIPCVTADHVKLSLQFKVCWQYHLPPVPLPKDVDPHTLPPYLFQTLQQPNPQNPVPHPEQPLKALDALKTCAHVYVASHIAGRDYQRAIQDMYRQSIPTALVLCIQQEGSRYGVFINKAVFISARQVHSVPHIAAMAEAEAFKLRHLHPAVKEVGNATADYILKSQSFWDAQKKSAVSDTGDDAAN